MRTVSRLRLLCFASATGSPQSYGFYIAGLSISILLTQSILCQAHQKHTIQHFPSWFPRMTLIYGSVFTMPQVFALQYVYGGPVGHCPRVLNPFLSTSYNHKLVSMARIELALHAPKARVMPFHYIENIWLRIWDSNPASH